MLFRTPKTKAFVPTIVLVGLSHSIKEPTIFAKKCRLYANFMLLLNLATSHRCWLKFAVNTIKQPPAQQFQSKWNSAAIAVRIAKCECLSVRFCYVLGNSVSSRMSILWHVFTFAGRRPNACLPAWSASRFAVAWDESQQLREPPFLFKFERSSRAWQFVVHVRARTLGFVSSRTCHTIFSKLRSLHYQTLTHFITHVHGDEMHEKLKAC